MNLNNDSAESVSDRLKMISDFCKEIAIMKKELRIIQIEIREEKKKREEAVFAKEKLLQLNKTLIEQVQLLKKERKPKSQECKMLELQRKLDEKNEMVQLMLRKRVTIQKEKMALTPSSEHPFNVILSDQSIIINPGERDSGLEMTQPQIESINGIMGSQSIHDAVDETEKRDFIRKDMLEVNEGKEAEGKETKMVTIDLEKSDEDGAEEKIEQIATELGNKDILKDWQHLTSEREIQMRSEMESLKKKLKNAEEGNKILQQQALEMNAKMDEFKKEHEQAAQDKEMVEEELRGMKKLKNEMDMIYKRAFDEEVVRMKRKNDQLIEDLIEALEGKQKAEEEMEKMKKLHDLEEEERERDYGEVFLKIIKEQNAMKKKAKYFEQDLQVQIDDREEIEMKFLSLENKYSKLQKDNAKTLEDLLEERKLEEDQIMLNKELTSNLAKLITEKVSRAAENINLTMVKNRIETRNEEIEKGYQEQEILLKKAQDSLRELIEDDYQRRLRKRRRRGWRKLKFWQ